MHPTAMQLRSLPIAERLQVIEDIWDDMASSNEPFPLRAWHRDEAERRAAELDANSSSALTTDELWRQVESNRD